MKLTLTRRASIFGSHTQAQIEYQPAEEESLLRVLSALGVTDYTVEEAMPQANENGIQDLQDAFHTDGPIV